MNQAALAEHQVMFCCLYFEFISQQLLSRLSLYMAAIFVEVMLGLVGMSCLGDSYRCLLMVSCFDRCCFYCCPRCLPGRLIHPRHWESSGQSVPQLFIPWILGDGDGDYFFEDIESIFAVYILNSSHNSSCLIHLYVWQLFFVELRFELVTYQIALTPSKLSIYL